ncbi:MAG: DUF5684 domain-containing protein [Candidatus Neomarinimicrobiota bacterium]
MKRLAFLNLFVSLVFAQESPNVYWNSLATDVTVGVPLVDDPTLIGGRVQIKVSFNGEKSYEDLGEVFTIEKSDIDDLKNVSVSANIFEAMPGFSEGGEAQFIAKVWDRAGNSIEGAVSDSVLSIDETVPTLVSLKNISSNEKKNLAMQGDSIIFDLITSEPIKKPEFEINGELYNDAAVGVEKSWKLIYAADEADDGPITFEINFMDLAGNPGVPITVATDSLVVTMDGTLPEINEVNLSSNNPYDKSWAVKGDSLFLQFISSEELRDIVAKVSNVETKILKEKDLKFVFYHVFTESDSEGVVPINLSYKDLAGNIGDLIDETSDDSEVNFDMTPPDPFKVETVGSLQGEQKSNKKKEKSGKDKSKSEDSTELGLIPIILLSFFSLTVLVVRIARFIIFSKSGQAGWKALVPFFNLFIFTKIASKPVWWIVIYLLFPIGFILSSLQISKLFDKKIFFAVGLILLPIIFYPMLAFGRSSLNTTQS